MDTVEAVASVLRALADARDGPFYELYNDLLPNSMEPEPRIGFRVYRAVGPAEADSYTVVWVSGTREDGRSVSWSLALEAGVKLRIVGSVEIDEENGVSRVLYEQDEYVDDAGAAARGIAAIAGSVCAQRHWWDPSST